MPPVSLAPPLFGKHTQSMGYVCKIPPRILVVPFRGLGPRHIATALLGLSEGRTEGVDQSALSMDAKEATRRYLQETFRLLDFPILSLPTHFVGIVHDNPVL